MSMETISEILVGWELTLCKKIKMGALYSRNPIAHKWKATYRSMVLRELVYWRLTDLLKQTIVLGQSENHLGAKILLRSSYETLAILIYLNQKIQAVLTETEKFNAFSDLTERLMLGSKDKSTKLESVNILTILEKCDQKYQGIFDLYKSLSESAHPNYAGICVGYSYVNEDKYETVFKNRWSQQNGKKLENSILLCIVTFQAEYDEVFTELFDKLEKWLEENNERLEKERTGT